MFFYVLIVRNLVNYYANLSAVIIAAGPYHFKYTPILGDPVKKLSYLYDANFKLVGLGLTDTLALLAVGIFLGILGSWIAVKRHLRSIEPG